MTVKVPSWLKTADHIFSQLSFPGGISHKPRKMSESTCFFGELLMSPFGSYTHGETVFEEFTTVDQCTRNIAGHLQTLHLREWAEVRVRFNTDACWQVNIYNYIVWGRRGSTSISHKVVNIFRVRLIFFLLICFSICRTIRRGSPAELHHLRFSPLHAWHILERKTSVLPSSTWNRRS